MIIYDHTWILLESLEHFIHQISVKKTIRITFDSVQYTSFTFPLPLMREKRP